MKSVVDTRCRRNGCCADWCCKRCMGSGASVCCASSWATTCCVAGLWDWRWKTRRGITAPIPQNRDRLIDHEVIRKLFGRVMQQAEEAKLLSSEHFSVDGTLIRAWASIKNFVPKDGPPPDKGGSKSNPEVDFKRQKRSNTTQREVPDAVVGKLRI